MVKHYSEDELCEQPAIGLFTELGWQTLNAMDETLGVGGTLGRISKSEAVLEGRLRQALIKLNPSLPSEAIQAALDELTANRAAMAPAAANHEVYQLLKHGVKVSVPDRERGAQKEERVRVVDWQNPSTNDFLLVNQMTIVGPLYTCRPDLIGFVNGLPLVVIEFKKPGIPARQAFDDNLTSYKHVQNGIPALFWYNALLIASNGTDSRVGSLTADWERFFDWKRIEREDEPRRVSLEVLLRGTCEKTRLLDLLENFSLFSEHSTGLIKILGQNHQFLGVNNAITASLKTRSEGHGRAGVFWQTQGSGKSFSMVFYAQKILRQVPGDWTFVIVTDRVELDEQIAQTFKACGAVSEAESKECHASNGARLRTLLRGNHRYVFTLIHKFQTPELLCDRRDVIVITDEAHRSQYDTLALNMRAALPNALFIAFTGTPLIAGEERTRDVFGDYVSIYDFQQSVQDGATVPLFYENRTPELSLENPNLNDQIYNLIEEAELSEDAERKLERELGRQYHLITRDDRLETVAKDIVRHYLGRGFQGKAMVISIDKITTLRMHDKVKKHWQAELERVKKELGQYAATPDPIRTAELHARLEILKTIEMAVIVSPGQNEIEQMRKEGLDIAPHRKRMNDEDMAKNFKDPENPLRMVFVCAMWLTGFDAPSVSTIYLDKPMRNHTLMQTIARANRVFPGKHSGMIVDYANVLTSLEKALAIYGAGVGGKTPVQNKQKLVDELRQAMADVEAFCLHHKVSLPAIVESTGMDRLHLLARAIDTFISPDPLRKEFQAFARLVSILFSAVKPDPATLEFSDRAMCLSIIAAEIKARTGEGNPDISSVMADIDGLLDESIAANGFVINDPAPGEEASSRIMDLSKIDFAALAMRFKKSDHQKIDLEQLKAAIRVQLNKLIRLNRTRTNYLDKFEELIQAYNAGSRNIEELFQDLLELSRNLTAEQQRHIRENLSEPELTVFDLLMRPGPNLSKEEREEVKKVARALLNRLKTALVLNWRQKAQARAQVRTVIEDVLDDGLPRAYDPELFKAKTATIFEHVYESQPGETESA